MTVGVRALWLAACIGAAAVAVVAAWNEDPPQLTVDDARRFTVEALTAAGFQRVHVLAGPIPSTYRPKDAPVGEPIPVWRVRASADKYQARLWIHRTEGRAVNIDEGKKRFLTDEQFGRLEAFSLDDAVDRQRRRNIAGTCAAVLAALVGMAVVLVDRRVGP
jgi:hypothetical protein